MKRNRFTCLVIVFVSLFLLKNVNCDSEFSKEQGNKPKLKVAVILPLSEPNSDGLTCSNEFYEDALQNVEALYYALDQMEQNDTLSRKFTLTIEVIENCGQLTSELMYLTNLSRQLKVKPVYAENATVGLIYTNDLTELRYDTIFKSFPDFPRISYSGPPARIQDEREIETDFLSGSIMLTSGHVFIADVMFEILKQLKWKYIAIYTDDGKLSQIASFFWNRAQVLAESNEVCVSHAYIIRTSPKLKAVYKQRQLEHTYNKVDVIICYCEKEELRNLKKLLKTFNKKYIVIAGSMDQYWAQNEVNWTSDLGELYYVTPIPQYHDEKFYNYYTALSMNSTTKHTYLKKLRERYFEAKFDSKMKDIKTSTSVYRDIYKNDSKATVNLIKSLHTMTYVLNEVDTTSDQYRESAARTISQVKLEFSNEELRFSYYKRLPEGEKFDIYKLKAIGNHSGNFFKIGEYLTVSVEDSRDIIEMTGELNINHTDFEHSKDYPKRTCGEQCFEGHFRKREINRCCWECVACNDSEVSNGEATSCEKCALDTVPDQNKSACIPITEILPLPTKWNDSQNLISIGISSLSITLTAIVMWVFVKYQNTPAVKSTTRELCYVMFAGIILVNVTLLISAMTSNFKTADGKILPAVGFTMIYAALLVKTNRIARLLVTPKHKFANMNLKYVSLKAQVSITSILIGIEIVICWFAVKFHNPDPDIRGSDLVLRMFYLDGVFFIEILAFVALLILFCTYYAFKTRNLPENFNETKCIGFAMYATVLTALAFSMVYFATDTSNKILAMNLCASINTLTILIFLFAPKLYIILWKPERNTRVYFSPVTSSIRSYIGKESRPNACKPLNQCYSLETSGPQSSSTDAVENVKENERNVIEKVIREIDFQQKILNLDTLKEKVKIGDLQLDEMIDDLQKAYFEKIEKVKLKYNVDVNRVEKNEDK